jgi:phage-related protein (TIGR01555 family)
MAESTQLEMFPTLAQKVSRKKLIGKNSFTRMIQMLDSPHLFTQEVSSHKTLLNSINPALITQSYMYLSQLYVNNGLIATALENPINDAFSKGFDIKSEHLSAKDVSEIMRLIEEKEFVEKIKEAMTWQSLFGGGGLVIAREYDEASQRIFSLDKGEEFDLFPVNRWQLNFNSSGFNPSVGIDVDNAEYFWFANEQINAKNVIILKGKKAPFMVSQQLNGWGMSEIERMVRDLNVYTKTREVLFEILDESKIDVFQINGFMEAVIGNREEQLMRRIEMQSKLKNYKNALVLDSQDNYQNKQNTFTGLSEVSHQNRIDIAAALRQPVVKLFGTSPAGFSSGEEEFNQYYQMVDSGARKIAGRVLRTVVSLCANSLFGFSPSFEIVFPPFKTLSELELETLTQTKIANAAQLFQLGAIDSITEHLTKRGVEL